MRSAPTRASTLLALAACLTNGCHAVDLSDATLSVYARISRASQHAPADGRQTRWRGSIEARIRWPAQPQLNQ
jgi:hypothetical protein